MYYWGSWWRDGFCPESAHFRGELRGELFDAGNAGIQKKRSWTTDWTFCRALQLAAQRGNDRGKVPTTQRLLPRLTLVLVVWRIEMFRVTLAPTTREEAELDASRRT